MSRVYADYAAAAPLRPEARAALRAAFDGDLGNAASAHWAGAAARARLESAREEIAAAIGAPPLEVVFTSGATEANNLALAGVATAAAAPLRLAVAATEHASVLRAAEALAARGHVLVPLPVSHDGLVDPESVVAARADLLSVALVNAETGVRQDVEALARAAAGTGALLHVDAAQALATVAVDVRRWPVDLLTLSSHKLGGPAGVGALWVRRGTALAPVLHGGPQEAGRRAGTEAVAAITGFAAALVAASEMRAAEAVRLAGLTARLRVGIATLDPAARLTAPAHGSPHLVHASFAGLVAESLVAALDLEGVAVSAGSACAAGAAEPSHVLLAMGRSRAEAAAGLRISLGWASTAADVEAILTALARVLARARGVEAAWPALAS